MNKKQLSSQQTRQKVADAARTLFGQKGYASTSIEDIVTATQISKGNIYYHFKNKEGLFLYLLEEWTRDWAEQFQAKKARFHTVKEQMIALVEHFVMDGFHHPLTKASNEFYATELITSPNQDKIEEMMQMYLRNYEELLEEGMQKGEFKPDDARLLSMILEGMLAGIEFSSNKLAFQEARELYLKAMNVFLYGITGLTEAPAADQPASN
ncbi:TetR/AcrR family transcriptional regulator [Paenibacillus dokdonensis]|uniref:TetR/AcrR family transcriptional regulator n=1 Tax=Paenibacillus dokdonensis TaxID=2567944 RepID=A0ABU6GM99_9BACL|nr:TetR/AcrR family transcriptional regulator [Paenibacillus dokdonensis]MEC0240858.1 TetR/AcrR family transcriptional regulator [Paenibacillus dokdonensis]